MNSYIIEIQKEQFFKDWNLKELTLSDKSLYNKCIKQTKYPANSWSGNFSYLWAHTNSPYLTIYRAEIDDLLVTFILTNKGRLYLPTLPFGHANPEKLVDVLLKCAKVLTVWNQKTGFSDKSLVNPINEAQLTFLKESKKYQQYFTVDSLTGIERHYSIPLLLNLTGKDFANIRNRINKFNKTYPKAIIREYNPRDYNQVINLGKVWEETSGQNYTRIIDGFYFKPLIKYAKELEHYIILIELEEKIIGLTTAEILPTGEAWGAITKFDKSYIGLSEKLIIEIIKYVNKISPKTTVINVGSDLGSKGLAFYKERFKPVLNYKRYALFYKINKD